MLNVNNLSFSYNSKAPPLLREFNLTMDTGDILGLLGPNGAGKTSLVSLITGILQPSSGTITVDGAPARLGRNDIALVPQEYAFYERLSGRENLQYFAGVLGLRRAAMETAIERALADCELQDVADRRAGHYSGGLKRRLNIALALLQEPRLLILDEPTAGVDPHSRAFLLDLVRRLNRDGVSVIYTSHLLDEVQALCNRVVVMDAGRVLLQGPMDALLAEQGRYLVVVLQDAVSAPESAALGGVAIDDHTLQFDLPTLELSAAQQLLKLDQAGCRIRRLSYGERRLEKLFFELTRRELRD